MHRRSILLFTALRLAVVPPLAAQAPVGLALSPLGAEREQPADRAGPGTGLASVYTLSLVSDWPQLTAGGSGCVNGGQETLSGTLTRTARGDYAGQLERRATILFCGVHGVARSACALTLTSRGPVEAEGHVLPSEAEGASPAVELRWVAAAGADGLEIQGDCAAPFNQSLRRLYLGVIHRIEFPLPLAGQGARRLRLEGYGWILEIQ